MIFPKIGIFDKTIKKIIGNLRKIVFEFDTFLYSFKKSFKVTELLSDKFKIELSIEWDFQCYKLRFYLYYQYTQKIFSN